MRKKMTLFIQLFIIGLLITTSSSCKKDEPIIKKDVVITWSNPSDIVPGTPLNATQLNATVDIAGTFVYTPSIGTVLSVGVAQNLKVDFTPTDSVYYNTTTKTVMINVIDPLTIGTSYQGGKIAYIFQVGDPGYVASETHGLISAPSDQSTGSRWGCWNVLTPGADGTTIGTGAQNTIDIVATCTEQNRAAKICSDLVLGVYSDWYLPSRDELQKLYENRNIIGGLSGDHYLSSSEKDIYSAWGFNFNLGSTESLAKDVLYNYVRAIRSF